MRMQHYAIFLQGFHFDIKFRRSEQNCNADCLSRPPLANFSKNHDTLDTFYINTVNTLPVTYKDIVRQNKIDTEIRDLIVLLKSKKISTKKFWNIDIREFSVDNE